MKARRKSSKQVRTLRALVERSDSVARLAKREYSDAVREIRKEIAYQSQSGRLGSSARSRELVIAKVEKTTAKLRKKLDKLFDTQLAVSAKAGHNEAVAQTGVTIKFSKERADAIIQVVKAEGGGGLAANFTQSMTKQMTSALRNAVVDAFTESAVTGASQREIAESIREKWQKAAKQGENLSFVDRSGKVWDTDAYLRMNVRTNTMRIYNQSMVNTITQATGGDLVQISSEINDNTCDACAEWAGKIVSVSGLTDGFPTLQEAKDDGVFHPNCVHTLHPIDEELDADEIAAQRKEYAEDEQ